MPEVLALQCRGVTKTFGKGHASVDALQGIDLEVEVGELMMLVGPSGSGKTTLLTVVAGLMERDGGECEVYGQDPQAMSERRKVEFRGDRIGFVFQSFHLIPSLTIAENVAIPLLIKGKGRAEALRRSGELLADVGLGHRLDARPRELSGGEKQRTAICRGIIHGPQLVVCDEPTSALDHETGEQVLTLLKERTSGEGKTLIVVTHDSRIFSYADRIAEMEDGSIVKMHDSPEELMR